MKTIKTDSRGDEVKTLQRRLNLAVDGIFGKLTEEAVKEFQKLHGLIADGIVGVQTWQALGIDHVDLRLKQSKRIINEIIVHCSATAEGKDYSVDELHTLLEKTDYKIIKNYEFQMLGLPLPYDPQEVHDEKQAWRDELNRLENV